MMKRFGLLSASLLLLGAPAAAHELWLTPGGTGGVHVHFGHPDEPSPPSAEKLVTLSAIGVGAKTELTAAPVAGAPVLRAALPEGGSLVAASYDNGYWVRLADGRYRNASKRLLPQGEKSQWSIKFAKATIGPDAPWDRIVGHSLEIVPLEAPDKAAGRLRVRVLFEGRPLAGAHVSAGDGRHAGQAADLAGTRTDAEGIATVPLKPAGPQLLSVSRRVSPSQTPALADSDSYAATFGFTLVDAKTQ